MIYTDAELASFLSKCRAANCKNEGGTAKPDLHSGVYTEKEADPEELEELVREARAAGHTGPLILGPSRSSLKHSWRDDARWLEENVPEEFGPPRNQPSSALCVERSLCSGRLDSASREETQCPPLAPESLQDAPEMLPAPPPTPLLESGFWQRILFGNPDSFVPGSEATRALQLVSDKLGIGRVEDQTIETLRAAQLRKLLHSRFGPSQAERIMLELWSAAPVDPRAPQPGDDQSHCTPGVWECSRSMPAWRRELNDPVDGEMQWQIENGCWCG